jgi:hypothetical protein
MSDIETAAISESRDLFHIAFGGRERNSAFEVSLQFGAKLYARLRSGQKEM